MEHCFEDGEGPDKGRTDCSRMALEQWWPNGFRTMVAKGSGIGNSNNKDTTKGVKFEDNSAEKTGTPNT